MNNIWFSLVFPTRERIDVLKGLFESLAATTTNASQIEIIAVADDDDLITVNAVPSLKNIVQNFHCRFIFRKRSNRLNEDYINFAARQSQGKFIFVLNDDVVFKIQEWDIKSNNKLEEFLLDKPDRIVYGLSDDGMSNVRQGQRGLQYSGFPIISKESINALGYAMHPKFNSWSADIHLYPIYNAVNRICDLREEVCAFHHSHHTGTRERDKINEHVQSINSNGPGHIENINDINKLKIITGQPLISDNRKNNESSNIKTDKGQMSTTGQPRNISSQYLRRVALINRNRR